jgi:hypothetical protein
MANSMTSDQAWKNFILPSSLFSLTGVGCAPKIHLPATKQGADWSCLKQELARFLFSKSPNKKLPPNDIPLRSRRVLRSYHLSRLQNATTDFHELTQGKAKSSAVYTWTCQQCGYKGIYEGEDKGVELYQHPANAAAACHANGSG